MRTEGQTDRQTDRQTDMTTLTVALRSSSNAFQKMTPLPAVDAIFSFKTFYATFLLSLQSPLSVELPTAMNIVPSLG